jgi:hypothetical protein
VSIDDSANTFASLWFIRPCSRAARSGQRASRRRGDCARMRIAVCMLTQLATATPTADEFAYGNAARQHLEKRNTACCPVSHEAIENLNYTTKACVWSTLHACVLANVLPEPMCSQASLDPRCPSSTGTKRPNTTIQSSEAHLAGDQQACRLRQSQPFLGAPSEVSSPPSEMLYQGGFHL